MSFTTVISLILVYFLQTTAAQSIINVSVLANKPITLSSDRYPDLVKTWTSLASTPYRITQDATQWNLLFLFDRYDLQPRDALYLCTYDEYLQCPQGLIDPWNLGTCNCSVEVTDQQVEWNIEKGDPIIAFTANYIGGLGYKSKDFARGGYRTTVMMIEPAQKVFFECGSTTNLTTVLIPNERPAPLYFVSQGYPGSTQIVDNCEVQVLASDGIRVTLLDMTIASSDTFTLKGTSTDGSNVTYNASGDKNATVHYYFRESATISFTINSGFGKRFAIYVENFEVVAPSCPFLPEVHNTEFDITTPAFSKVNYDDNQHCTWKMNGLKPESQLVLELRDVRLEYQSDVFYARDFEKGMFTGRTAGNFWFSAPNITETEFSLVTDGVEALVGVDAHVHILDCSGSQAQYNLSSGQSMTLGIPGNNSKSFCKGVPYKYTINVPQGLALSVNFPVLDIDYNDNLTISADGEVLRVRLNTSLLLSNHSSYEIGFITPVNDYTFELKKGVQISLSVEQIPRENVSICSSMEVINSLSMKGYDIQEYSISSCRRDLAVYILADKLEAGTITLFNGDFDTGNATHIELNNMMYLKGPLISIRISTVFKDTQHFKIIISDSFVDVAGIPCGGVVNFDIQLRETYTKLISYPCVLAVYGTFDRMLMDEGEIEMYGGFTFGDATKELGMSSNEYFMTDVHLKRVHHTITIRPLQGFKGNIRVESVNGNTQSSPIVIDDMNTNHYLYSSILVDENMNNIGSWDIFTQLSSTMQAANAKFYVELVKPVGSDDALCLPTREKCYTRADGLVQQELPFTANITYEYSRHPVDSLLSARVYAAKDAPPSPTTEKPTVTTTTVQNSMPTSTASGGTTSTASTTVTTTNTGTTTTVAPSGGNGTTTTHNPGKDSAHGHSPIFITVLCILFAFWKF